MSELPAHPLPGTARGLLEIDGALFLLIIGSVALLFVGYLVYDWAQGQVALRRLERLRGKRRPPSGDG